MNTFIKNQITRHIKQLQTVVNRSDIYGCEIKLRVNTAETDWLIISEDQVLQLIEAYKIRIK